MAVIRCPNCGKPNPDFLEVCQYCDARLHSADGSPADSRAPSSAEDTFVGGRPAAPPAPAVTPEPDDAQPLGWMDRLRQIQSGEAAPAAKTPADEPDWMWTGTLRDPSLSKDASPANPASAAPTPPAANNSAADLPEWLRDLSETGTLPPLEPPAPPLPPAPTTAPASPAPAASSITNSQLPITPEPAEPSPFEPTASDVTIPPRSRRKMTDWLNKLQELPPPTPTEAPAEPVIPNTDADLPDWLRAMAAEAETPGSATPAVEAATQHLAPSAAQTPEDELPDWLRALRAKSEPPRPAPGTAALHTGSLNARRNQELPDTMRPPAADETLIPRPGAKPLDTAAADMPDWLKGILNPAPDAPAASDSAAASDQPATLTGPAADAGRKPGGSRPIGGAAARDILPPVPSMATAKPPASTPAPLEAPRGTPAPPAMSITGQQMPAPAQPATPPTAPPAAPPPAASVPAAPPPAIDDTLPPPSRRAKRLTDWLGKTPTPAAEPAPADQLPDWLTSLSAESAAKEAQAQQAAAPAEALPDWLQTTPPTPAEPAKPAALPAAPPVAPITNSQLPITPQPAPTDEMPDWVKAMAPPAASEPLAAAPAEELPDWLKAMAPSAAAAELPAAPEPAAAAPQPARAAPITNYELPITSTPAEDLPDWLKELRPTAAPAEPAEPAEQPAAPEPAAAAPQPAPAAPITHYELPITTPPADDLPDWLRAITQDAAADSVLPDTTVAAPAGRPPAPAAEPAALASDDLPDWLKAITQDQAAPAAEPAAAPITNSQLPISPQPAAPAATPEPPATTPLPALPVAAAAEELPDWLKAITQEHAAEPAAAPISNYELPVTTPPAELTAATPEPTTATSEPPVTAPLADNGEELPDWLKAITQASSAAATAATAEPAAASIPDTELPATPQPAVFDAETTLVPGPTTPAGTPITNYDLPITPQPEPADQPATPVDLPPWLVGVGTAPLPELQEMPDLDEETLAWLSESKKAETTPEPAGLDLSGAKLPAEKPDWLNELAAVSTTPTASPAAEPEVAPTPAEDMPEWLRTMRGQAGAEATSTEATPDWLRSLRGQAAATAPAAEPAAASITNSQLPITASPTAAAPTPNSQLPVTPPAEGLTQSALPAWLAAMRPVDIEQPLPTAADSYEETLGVLAGMRGVLRAEPVVAQPHKASAARQNLVVSDAHTAQVNLLTELLQPEAATATARRGRARLGAHAERWVIFAVLLLALVLSQFQTQLQAHFGLPALFGAPSASLPPESAAVYNLIQNAPTTKPALVAFDYDAAQAGELNPGAQAVVDQLARRGVPVAAVSLQLTGPALAQQVLSQAALSGYVNLGYIPGGPVGLLEFAASPTSSFSTDFNGQTQVWTQPTLASVRSLGDFGMIVLVSGTPEDTRAWIEQAQTYAPGVPMVAVISAGAEAMLRPYYDDPDANSIVAGHLPLKGLIVGLGGAASYEQATGAPGAASTLWPALGGGLLAAAVIILAGNLFFGVFGALRRRRA